ALLAKLEPVDLVVIEGFKRDRHAKLEVHRAENGKSFLFPDDPDIKAIASDAPVETTLSWAHLDDIPAIAELVLKYAEPIEAICV
ncbi:MAG TPA: molybdopterin-guanine dinucleotide biosynthesis protein MobB, partial [Methylovirgula sp.]